MIFVTGGTGFVGAHLLYDLVSRGEKVRALKRPGSSVVRTAKIFSFYSIEYKQLMQNIEWVEGDLLDKDGLRLLLKGVDQIYHAAAIISFDPRERETMVQNNCEGTANIADLALSLQIPQFCHISSVSAIGTPPDKSEANEEHPWHNNRDHSGYAESKYLSEMEVWRACLQGLNVVIVNPSVIIGPDNWKSGSSILFSRTWKGMKFYTKGGTGFVDVRDVTTAIQRLMANENWESTKNQRYILNSENIHFRELLNRIADCLSVKRPKFLAGNLLLNLACRISTLVSRIMHTPPFITCETARSANNLNYYDGSKITRTIGFRYTPAADTIQNASALFLKDIQSKQ